VVEGKRFFVRLGRAVSAIAILISLAPDYIEVMEKKKAKTTIRRFRPDSNLTPEDHQRIGRAFKVTLRKIQKLEDSQVRAYEHIRELKKRLRELEKKVSSFIEPS
jgi:tellurite resistance protein